MEIPKGFLAWRKFLFEEDCFYIISYALCCKNKQDDYNKEKIYLVLKEIQIAKWHVSSFRT